MKVVCPHMRHAMRGACDFNIDAGGGGWWWRLNGRIVIMIPTTGAQRQHEWDCKEATVRSRMTTLHEGRFLRQAPRDQTMTK
jgi:hypothetical protein